MRTYICRGCGLAFTMRDESADFQHRLCGVCSAEKVTKELNQSRESKVMSDIVAEVKEKEAVDHPSHYNSGNIECIDYIEDCGFGEGFNLGNAIKYIARANHKNNKLEDLRKSLWYLNREIERISKDED